MDAGNTKADSRAARLLRSVVEAGASDADLLQLKGFGEACLRDVKSAVNDGLSFTWNDFFERTHVRRMLNSQRHPNKQLENLLAALDSDPQHLQDIDVKNSTTLLQTDSQYSMQCDSWQRRLHETEMRKELTIIKPQAMESSTATAEVCDNAIQETTEPERQSQLDDISSLMANLTLDELYVVRGMLYSVEWRHTRKKAPTPLQSLKSPQD